MTLTENKLTTQNRRPRPGFAGLAAAVALATLVTGAPLMAQEEGPPPTPQEGGWRRTLTDAAAEAGQSAPPSTALRSAGPAAPLPSQVVVPAGTWITIRTNQVLSSDQSRPGEVFTGTLAQPLVGNGIVLARRGQTIGGRVAEAVRAGRARGTSRLAVELTELSLADGRQVPVVTQLIEYAGGTSIGRDLTTVGTTTGMGALIGGAAAGGAAAGIGAGAGAAAAAIGVLLTRGRPTILDPEATLTFRTLAPLTVSTEQAEHAFESVRQTDYEARPQLRQRVASNPPPVWGGWGGWGGWGPYWGSPWFGPGIGVNIIGGRGWGGWGGRGWGGGGRRWR